MFNETYKQRLYALCMKVGNKAQVHGARDWQDNIVTFIEQVVNDKLALMEQEPEDYEDDSEPSQYCRACGGTGMGFTPNGDCPECAGKGFHN